MTLGVGAGGGVGMGDDVATGVGDGEGPWNEKSSNKTTKGALARTRPETRADVAAIGETICPVIN